MGPIPSEDCHYWTRPSRQVCGVLNSKQNSKRRLCVCNQEQIANSPSSASCSQNGVVSRFKASSFFFPTTPATAQTKMSTEVAFIVSVGAQRECCCVAARVRCGRCLRLPGSSRNPLPPAGSDPMSSRSPNHQQKKVKLSQHSSIKRSSRVSSSYIL